jgi:hypothetical protein
LNEIYKIKNNLNSISEISKFMESFKTVQAEHSSLSNHVYLATEISNLTIKNEQFNKVLKLEDSILSLSKPIGKIVNKTDKIIVTKKMNLNLIIKIICLINLTFFKQFFPYLQILLKSLIHSFGPEILPIIQNLSKSGILRFSDSPGVNWGKIREDFKLFIDTNLNENKNEIELSEPFSGYIPLSIRLIQKSDNWKNLSNSLNLIKGPAIEISQEIPVPSVHGNRVTLVVFVGGITRGEIACLKKIEKNENKKFLILTTNLLNYNNFLNSLKKC